MSQETNHTRGHAPATLRNRQPILEVLRRILPPSGFVLEIASGSGEHAVFFAEHLPGLVWQPSDIAPEALQSITAWIEHTGVSNVRPPVLLDASADAWPVTRADACVNINMIHISPWEACQGLMRGAAQILPPQGLLFLYGPFKVGGRHTAPSNAAFDQSLRARNPAWGVRDLEEVQKVALSFGLFLQETVQMPANNLSVIFCKQSEPSR